MYYYDIVRGDHEINIFKQYDSISNIIDDYDIIVDDLFMYTDDDLDFDSIEELKKFSSVDGLIESLRKNQIWKLSVIQEEIEKFNI